jgi:hypothetical protein
MLLWDKDKSIENSTLFTTINGDDSKITYAKSLEAEVSWEHGKSTQSIKMAKVVR